MGAWLAGQNPDWAFAALADNLVRRMIEQYGYPIDAIYVAPTSPLTAALRDALVRAGIELAPDARAAFTINHTINAGEATLSLRRG